MRLPGFGRPRLSYANVASTLALVLATSTGGAYAAATIGSADIKKNAVQSKHIAGGAVQAGDLAGNAVNSAKVKDGTLTGADLAPTADGVAMAGVTVSATSMTHQFNRVGAPVSVTHTDTGSYDVAIPGTSFNGSTRLVYSLSAGYARYCYVNNAGANGPTTVQIRCRTFGDTLSNADFTFVVFEDSVGAPVMRTVPRKSADGG